MPLKKSGVRVVRSLEDSAKGVCYRLRREVSERSAFAARMASGVLLGLSKETGFSYMRYASTYIGSRLNAPQPPAHFPGLVWLRRIARGLPADGKVEVLEARFYGCYFRYTEGPKDKLWMETQDRKYLDELLHSSNPADQRLFVDEMSTLNLTLPHHQNLKVEFGPELERILEGQKASRLAEVQPLLDSLSERLEERAPFKPLKTWPKEHLAVLGAIVLAGYAALDWRFPRHRRYTRSPWMLVLFTALVLIGSESLPLLAGAILLVSSMIALRGTDQPVYVQSQSLVAGALSSSGRFPSLHGEIQQPISYSNLREVRPPEAIPLSGTSGTEGVRQRASGAAEEETPAPATSLD